MQQIKNIFFLDSSVTQPPPAADKPTHRYQCDSEQREA